MKNFYRLLNRKKYLLTAMVVLVISGRTIAQCTLAIPAISGPSGTSTYNYYGTTVYDTSYTNEGLYPTHYNWICPGDTVNFNTNNGDEQCCGAVILDSGAVFILDYGAAGWTIWAKAGSTTTCGANGNNTVYVEAGANVSPNWYNGPSGSYNSCTPLTYSYVNITTGGCQVTVPAPTPQFSANATNVCAGNPVNFTDQSTGSPTGWKWTFQGGTPGSSSSQNPVIAYDTAGTFNVKLVVTNASGSDSLTKTGYITVTALPKPGTIFANPDTLCAGNTSTATVTGSTGSIQWQSSTGGSFTNIQNATDTFYNAPALTQNTELRIIAANGVCADTSAALQVTVNPLPTPPVISASDSIICLSDSALISSLGTYSTYQWNNGDNRSFTYAGAAGGYWLTVTGADGCSAISNHLNISVYQIASVSITVQGDTLSSFGALSYQWFFNGDSIANANTAVLIARQTGNYSVEVTDTNGCKSLSDNVQVTITGVSQPDISNGLDIYPDPFTNTLFIREYNHFAGIQNIAIYNVLGEVVINKKMGSVAQNPVIVDVSSLPVGAYYLRIRTTEGDVVEKVTKE